MTEQDVNTPMTGGDDEISLLDLLQTVVDNLRLLVLESMKMEHEVRAETAFQASSRRNTWRAASKAVTRAVVSHWASSRRRP